MKIKSFRVRIALLSILCSSVVLLGSSLVAGNIMWRTELRRVDRFISLAVQENLDYHSSRLALRWRPPGPPEGFGPDIPSPEMDLHRDAPPKPWLEDEDNSAFEPHRRLHRPPWRKPPWMQSNDDDASVPLSIYSYKDIASGRVYRSKKWPGSLPENDLLTTASSSVKYLTVSADGRLWRVGVGCNAQGIALFGVDLDMAVTSIKQASSAFLLSIPVALLLIGLGAVFMARRALRPVHDLTRLVERITASDLCERVQSPVKDVEFKTLIMVFNQMMDRLERSFMQANRFSADAAHELRTPVTILQGYLERMLQTTPPGSEMQQSLGEMVDEVHRIKSILEKLLLLAHMDAGQVRLHLSPVDLSAMMESIVEDVQALAPGITVEARLQPGIQVQADESLLETTIQNLASNAVKYNQEANGRILIELSGNGDGVTLSVSNTGPKISDADRDKIFDRFYRADKSRSRDKDGLGLGLSLAREIIQAHKGSVELAESSDGLNRFEIKLPGRHGMKSQ